MKNVSNGKILVIGGYGNVGKVICKTLADRFPGRVIAAGRNLSAAQQFSLQTNAKVLPLKLNVRQINEKDLVNISLVIMCIDRENNSLAKKCAAKGIYYIDISAEYKILSQIELLDSEAKQHQSTIILSVGLAPGLTNLLASSSKLKFDKLESINIHLLLGLGEVHGKAAIAWILNNLTTKYSILENGQPKYIESFKDKKNTVFEGHFGKRTTYSFNFLDQHTLPKTLGIKSASTGMCFDSVLMTRMLSILAHTGYINLARSSNLLKPLTGILQLLKLGTDKFVAKVEAKGTINNRTAIYETSISGSKEGFITGLVAAKVAEYLYTKPFPPGVFHIEQLFDLEQFVEDLETENLTLHQSELTPI